MDIIFVSQWKNSQVVEWLKGLDESIQCYIDNFKRHIVDGKHLINLNCDNLHHLGVHLVGHQEIILDSVKLLKYLNNQLGNETLRKRALKLNSRCTTFKQHMISQKTLFDDVTQGSLKQGASNELLKLAGEVLEEGKQVILWLERSPFSNRGEFRDIRSRLVKLCYELSTTMQQSVFACTIEDASLNICEEIKQTCNCIITSQEATVTSPSWYKTVLLRDIDPMHGIGIFIKVTFEGYHVVTGTRANSIASKCKMVQSGDELIAVNNKVVIGWTLTSLVSALKENCQQVILLLRKRPQLQSKNCCSKTQHWRCPSAKPLIHSSGLHGNNYILPDNKMVGRQSSFTMETNNTWHHQMTNPDTTCPRYPPPLPPGNSYQGNHEYRPSSHVGHAKSNHDLTSNNRKLPHYDVCKISMMSPPLNNNLHHNRPGTLTRSVTSYHHGNNQTSRMNSTPIGQQGNGLIKPIPVRLADRVNIVTVATNNDIHDSNAIDSLKIPPPPQEPYKPKSIQENDKQEVKLQRQHSPNSLLDMELQRRHTVIGCSGSSTLQDEKWYQTFMTKVRECNEAASGDKKVTKESQKKQNINTNKMKQLVLVANNQHGDQNGSRPLSVPSGCFRPIPKECLVTKLKPLRNRPQTCVIVEEEVNINSNNNKIMMTSQYKETSLDYFVISKNPFNSPPLPPPRSSSSRLLCDVTKSSNDVASHYRQTSLPVQQMKKKEQNNNKTLPQTLKNNNYIPVPKPRRLKENCNIINETIFNIST